MSPIHSKTNSGYSRILTIYKCYDCGTCQYKSKCTKSKGNKQLKFQKNLLLKEVNHLKILLALEK
mgnify:CR=1 FL=1